MGANFTIKTAEFKTSIADVSVYQSYAGTYDYPEICVTGRSNVGKSSFINMLALQKNLAKTSSLPGRTRLLNLFDFNRGDFMLVDLPGYGYAKAQKQAIQRWGNLVDDYFSATQKLTHVFALVDIRHEPSVLDKQMILFLYQSGLPFTVVATKLDKIKKSDRQKHIQMLASSLALGKDNIIQISAETREGRDAVIARIAQVLTVQ